MTRHQSGSAAIWLTVFVGGKMVVVTAQFLHCGPDFGRKAFDGPEGLGPGCHLAKSRSPEYVRTFTAWKSLPLDDSEMPFEPHEPPSEDAEDGEEPHGCAVV